MQNLTKPNKTGSSLILGLIEGLMMNLWNSSSTEIDEQIKSYLNLKLIKMHDKKGQIAYFEPK